MNDPLIFGLEWELAFGVEGPAPGPIPFEAAYSYLRTALCELTPWLGDGGNGIFSPAFRFYLDSGMHPEVAGVELNDPLDLLDLKDGIFSLMGRAMARVRRTIPGLVLLRTNHDYLENGSFWGCHESYALSVPPARLAGGMLSFLATRHLLAGNGRIDHRGRVLFSSRAPAMRLSTGGGTTRDRALYSTCRDEPLMKSGPFSHRLHLICGDSVMSQRSELLKIGTTLLVLRWLEEEPRGADDLLVASPLRLLKSANVLWTPPGKLRVSPMALEVQFAYLDRIEKFVAGPRQLPPWCSRVVALWGETLNALRDDPLSLSGSLDPFIKLALFEAALGGMGRTWAQIADDPSLYHRLALLDVAYHRVEEDGLFERLEREGRLDQRQAAPPDGRPIEELVRRLSTRAAPRAEAIQALSGTPEYSCTWTQIIGGNPPRRLDLGDPTRVVPPDWQTGQALRAKFATEMLQGIFGRIL